MGIDMDMGMVMGKRKAGRGEVGKTRRKKLLENSLVFFFFFSHFLKALFMALLGGVGTISLGHTFALFVFLPQLEDDGSGALLLNRCLFRNYYDL